MIEPRRVHHTGYTVSDLDRSVAFYRDLMGMEVVAQQEKQGGYLAAIVGYPDAHVRMTHLRVPGDDHVLELFEYLGGYLAAIVGYPDAHVRMTHLRVPGDDHVLELFEYLAPAGAVPEQIEPRDVGTAHLCFVVDDLPAAYRRLVEAGVDTFVSPPVEVDTGINTGGYGIYLRDPDGIMLEIFQPPAPPGEPS